MTHKIIVDDALKQLSDERASYFSDIVNLVAEDPRTEAMPNMVYLVLRETICFLPAYLPKKLMIDLLFDFSGQNRERINRLIFDERFILEPGCIREITNDFIRIVSNKTMEMYINGKIDSGEKTVHRVAWPYNDYDFPYLDDEDEEDEDGC